MLLRAARLLLKLSLQANAGKRSNKVISMVTTARKQDPSVQSLAQWIELAKALIGQGLGDTEYSGTTLTDWHAMLTSNDTRFLQKKFAIAAIQGLTAQHIRHQLGPAGDQLTIRLSFEETRH